MPALGAFFAIERV